MQPIIYTKEEFQASVNSKLAVLRQMRSNLKEGNAPFGERLALAEDRLAMQRAREDAFQRSGEAETCMFASRFEGSGSRTGERSPCGYTAADDRYGAGGSDASLSQLHGQPGEHAKPLELSEAEVELAGQLRLLEVNKRQASADWVVLERVSALHHLMSHPQGLTLAQLAQQLLGGKASPRDTRRLSAMMMREEVRETVTRAGRGQPITITEAGKRELQTVDVASSTKKTIDLQQDRVKAQKKRLDQKLARRKGLS